MSTVFCVAVDKSGDVLTYDGTAWASVGVIGADSAGFVSVACPTVRFCVALDRLGGVIYGKR
jgi:hypothetical protein